MSTGGIGQGKDRGLEDMPHVGLYTDFNGGHLKLRGLLHPDRMGRALDVVGGAAGQLSNYVRHATALLFP
jgi:hypothetical protein